MKDERCEKHPGIILYQGHCFVCASERERVQLARAGNAILPSAQCADCGEGVADSPLTALDACSGRNPSGGRP